MPCNDSLHFPSAAPSLGFGVGGLGGGFSGFPLTTSHTFSGVEARASVGAPFSTAPGPRDFWIAGIAAAPIPPGIVMYPTSEALNMVTVSGHTYVVASSQFYTIGEVHWNGQKRIENTDWQFVSPFKHIIKIINPMGVSNPITLIYYRWNIGVRSGFRVNSYPVPFAFNATSIIAEQVPAVNKFFTVEFTSPRPGQHPMSLYARYRTLVDDVLDGHTLYDGNNGFQTYRPSGYVVFDTTDNQLWQWNGSIWSVIGMIATNGTFYAKRQRTIYKFDGAALQSMYVSGDGSTMTFPEVLEYPPYGEGVGKNLLVDGFSDNAAVDFPAAYEISQRPGRYDDWVPI